MVKVKVKITNKLELKLKVKIEVKLEIEVKVKVKLLEHIIEIQVNNLPQFHYNSLSKLHHLFINILTKYY